MKHEAFTSHTWTTDRGIKVFVKYENSRFRGIFLQWPGSGERPRQIIPSELDDLVEAMAACNNYVKAANNGEMELEEAEPEVKLG